MEVYSCKLVQMQIQMQQIGNCRFEDERTGRATVSLTDVFFSHHAIFIHSEYMWKFADCSLDKI